MTAVQEPIYTARDKNAYRGARTHEFLMSDGNIERLTFPNDMSFIAINNPELAIKISRIEGFEVKDKRGMIIVPQQIDEETNLGEVVSLASDQVIANLSELTKEALIMRANEVGGTFKANTPKETLIQFIIDYNVANPGVVNSESEIEEELIITEEGGV